MDYRPPPPIIAVDIPSDGDESPSLLPHKKKKQRLNPGPTPAIVIIDDDPTPSKPDFTRTPSFVPDTPLDKDTASDAFIVRCSLARDKNNISGTTGLICLGSDNESENDSERECLTTPRSFRTGFGLVDYSDVGAFHVSASPIGSDDEHAISEFGDLSKDAKQNAELIAKNGSLEAGNGNADTIETIGDTPIVDYHAERDIVPQVRSYNNDGSLQGHADMTATQESGPVAADKTNRQNEAAARKKQQKEEKARLTEEKKQKRQEEKLQKERLKAEAAELKKIEKEKQKWEKGKMAIKSIVAEIDNKVLENGSVGGHLLTRFAEKGLTFRVTSNPIPGSIVWQMSLPDQIAQVSSVGSEVPYVLLIYQAEEFCNLVISDSLTDHVHRVQSQYPAFTVCYITNKLMSYINKCEQAQYKKASTASSWRRPPIEEALSRLTTHYNKVHSRQCIDEAEIAEHIVGLTSSLASCQFRKKLTPLSVHANGAVVPKDFIDRNLIKKNVWLKALVAIPKVQPRHAMAIWKKYPTMRSLLNIYMDPNKSVHDKEFLLKDLMIEGLLGKENRRLGEICLKRVYRILMAQNGGMKTDDVEDGADFFR